MNMQELMARNYLQSIETPVFVFDIDGTITNENGIIYTGIRETIAGLSKSVALTGFATGRSWNECSEIVLKSSASFCTICLDGQIVFDATGNTQFFTPLPNQTSEFLQQQAQDRLVIFEGEKTYYTQSKSAALLFSKAFQKDRCLISVCQDIPVPLLRAYVYSKTSILSTEITRQIFIWSRFENSVDVFRAGPNWIVLKPSGVNKGEALKKLSWRNSLRLSNVIAFGNGANDIEMLQCAGMGVAVQNAEDQLKAIAKIVIDEPAADGLIDFLNACNDAIVERSIMREKI